jgi:hypothetical protein
MLRKKSEIRIRGHGWNTDGTRTGIGVESVFHLWLIFDSVSSMALWLFFRVLDFVVRISDLLGRLLQLHFQKR